MPDTRIHIIPFAPFAISLRLSPNFSSRPFGNDLRESFFGLVAGFGFRSPGLGGSGGVGIGGRGACVGRGAGLPKAFPFSRCPVENILLLAFIIRLYCSVENQEAQICRIDKNAKDKTYEHYFITENHFSRIAVIPSFMFIAIVYCFNIHFM